MSRQSSYSNYPFTAPTASRYTNTHSTSSAMSPSANPDEDWTKISDLAERRRIQNRIAQRNYRKKLKRRLEDLERRAGSSSASPEQPHAVLAPIAQTRQRDADPAKKRKPKTEASPPNQHRSPNPPYSQGHPIKEDPSGMFSRQHTHQLSASPPPSFTYSYPMPEPPPIHAPYPQHSSFHSLPAPYSDYQGQPLYLPPLPVTLPSMSSYDSCSTKTDGSFNEDDMLSQFSMSYSPMAGIEAPTTQSYSDSTAYTPPLSLSHSFDHSRTVSPCEPSLIFPGTPDSMPGSPNYYMG